MEFQLINLLPSSWVHALGVTLFHSLWMGIILALLTSLIILTTRTSTASLRYNLLTIILCLFVVSMGAIFYRSLDTITAPAHTALQTGNAIRIAAAKSPLSGTAASGMLSQLYNLINLWTAWSGQIVLIWFLIICAKCMQLMVGLQSVYYLKRTNVFYPGRYWEDKVAGLAVKLGVTKSIKILQSGIAKVPLVAGHFKPVILLPLGMLNGLSLNEVEAILSHELAHIKRRDYIVNILQSLIEIVFFFNPAVLWVSNLIKEERENCCDDLALSCTTDKQEYIKALISCQEFQLNAPEYTMAVTGRKGQLIERVSRMVFNKTSSLNRMEKTVLTIVLISTLVFSAAFTNITSPLQVKKNTVIIGEKVFQDTIKKVNKKIVKKQTAVKKVTPVTIKRKADSANGKDTVVAREERSAGIAQRSALAEDRKARIERARAARADKARQTSRREAERYGRDTARYKAEMDRYAKEESRYRSGEIDVPPAPPAPPVDVTPVVPATPVVPVTPVIPATPPAPPAYKSHVNANTRVKAVTSVKVSAGRSGNIPGETDTEAINRELLKDGLISTKGSLSYRLDKDALEINGVRQPDAVHQKYKTKYLKRPNTSLLYNYEINTNE